MPLLQVRGLEKSYGRRKVVSGVDYDVDRGEVVGLLGPNGAGKTTSFRMTIGLIDSDGGKVMFDGRDVSRLPMYLCAARAWGTSRRIRASSGNCRSRTISWRSWKRAADMTRQTAKRSPERAPRSVRSDQDPQDQGQPGLRRRAARLEIARSLITEPKMIMLDEPFAGIDPKTVTEIQDQIRALVEKYNIGILLTDHQFRETLEVTDRCYVISEGRVFAYGNREQILRNPDVRRQYIGERFDVGHLLDRRRPALLAQPAPAITEAEPPQPDLAEPSPELLPSSSPPKSFTATPRACRSSSPRPPPCVTAHSETDTTEANQFIGRMGPTSLKPFRSRRPPFADPASGSTLMGKRRDPCPPEMVSLGRATGARRRPIRDLGANAGRDKIERPSLMRLRILADKAGIPWNAWSAPTITQAGPWPQRTLPSRHRSSCGNLCRPRSFASTAESMSVQLTETSAVCDGSSETDTTAATRARKNGLAPW